MARGVQLHGRDNTWRAPMSQSQIEASRGVIHPAPMPGHMRGEHWAVSLALWLAMAGVGYLVWAIAS